MKYLIYSLLIILLYGIMLGLFGTFRIGGNVPNLILLLCLFLALEEDSVEAYFVAVIGGLVLDFSGGTYLGGYLFGLVLLVFLCQLLFGHVIYYQFQLKYLPLLVVGAEVLVYLWIFLYAFIIETFHWFTVTPIQISLEYNFLPNLFYTLLLMYPIYFLSIAVKSFISKFSFYSK